MKDPSVTQGRAATDGKATDTAPLRVQALPAGNTGSTPPRAGFITDAAQISYPSVITFQNGYYADDVQLQLSHMLEGTPKEIDLSAVDFNFTGQCTIPADKGYLAAEKGFALPNGDFSKEVGKPITVEKTLRANQIFALKVPNGTVCKFAQQAPDFAGDPALQQLTKQGLTIGAAWGAPQDDAPRSKIDFAENTITLPFTYSANPIAAAVNQQTSLHAKVINTVYRNKAAVAVEQVNLDGTPIASSLAGVLFNLHGLRR